MRAYLTREIWLVPSRLHVEQVPCSEENEVRSVSLGDTVCVYNSCSYSPDNIDTCTRARDVSIRARRAYHPKARDALLFRSAISGRRSDAYTLRMCPRKLTENHIASGIMV